MNNDTDLEKEEKTGDETLIDLGAPLHINNDLGLDKEEKSKDEVVIDPGGFQKMPPQKDSGLGLDEHMSEDQFVDHKGKTFNTILG